MRLSALFIHPIKSCAGIAVARAEVTRRGLRHDRRWMVVDGDGRFLTQRKHPRMALVQLALAGDGYVVTRAGLPSLSLPSLTSTGARVEIEVWKHRGPAVRHDEGSDWFTRALGQPAQLVCTPDEIVRPVTGDGARDGDEVSFADGFPLLIATTASLADLNTRSNFRTDVRRFRPNLVIDGAPPWAEDEWRALRVGALPVRVTTPCARCTIPGVDPDSAELTKEPLRTLATFRTRDHEVYFGVNAIPDGVCELRVGDAVAVVASEPA